MKQELGLFVNPETSYSSLYDAYLSCAELLFEQVKSNHHSEIGTNINAMLSLENSALIYPLFFNYRQCLELMLKKSLEITNKKAKRTHNLKELYEQLLTACGDECDPKVIKVVNDIQKELNWFHKLDTSGTSFRYEDANHERVCILRLRTCVNSIYSALEAVISNFAAIQDSLSDKD